MKNKKRISIQLIIFIPVCILGIVAVISNIEAIRNLKNVNQTAVEIAEEHMVNLSQLSDIQRETQDIHKLALSHIIATDLDTLIGLVDNVRSEEEVLEDYLEAYRDGLVAMDESAYNQLITSYEGLKYEIANLLAYSGNNKKEEAFALANGLIKEYSNDIQAQVTKMENIARESAQVADNALKAEYQKALVRNIASIVICILVIFGALYSVFIFVIRKLNIANREIHDIIEHIDRNEGDLTKY